jgi:hypothetical protein
VHVPDFPGEVRLSEVPLVLRTGPIVSSPKVACFALISQAHFVSAIAGCSLHIGLSLLGPNASRFRKKVFMVAEILASRSTYSADDWEGSTCTLKLPKVTLGSTNMSNMCSKYWYLAT